MEWIVYPLAAIGALAPLLLAGVGIAELLRPEEARHVDPDLLVEIPAAGRLLPNPNGAISRSAASSRQADQSARPTTSAI